MMNHVRVETLVLLTSVKVVLNKSKSIHEALVFISSINGVQSCSDKMSSGKKLR